MMVYAMQKQLIAVEFVADHKSKLLSAGLENRLQHYCFYFRLKQGMPIISIKLTHLL